MGRLSGYTVIQDLDLYQASSTGENHTLGEIASTKDGRRFTYVKAGGTTLVEGNLQQSAAENTNYQEMAVQAAVAVSTSSPTKIPITLGASATTAGQFNEGILSISTTPGIGQFFRILYHDVAASGTANFYVEENVRTALTTSSKASVMKHQCDSVIIHPTTSTGVSVGVAQYAITNANWGWVQCGGLAACLGDATPTTAALQSITPSVATAGAVTKQVSLAEVIGTSYTAVSISAKVLPVWLTINH